MAEKYATIEKVSEGFSLAKSRFDEIEMTVDEAKDCIKQLQSQLRQTHALSVPLGDGQRTGRGFWGHDSVAKEFGECVLKALGRKDLGVGVPSGAGVLVPDEVSRRWVDMLGVYGRFRRNTTVLPMNSASALVPRLRSDMDVFSVGENRPITKSQPTFDQIRLTPRTWAALCAVSKELDDDSVIAVAEVLGISIARSMARQEDRVGFLGDGSETYFSMTGIIGALLALDPDPAQIAGICIGTGSGWAGLTLNDFEALDALLPEDAEDGAKFYVSKPFWNKVMRVLAADLATSAMFDLLSDKRGRYFMGYPVEFVSVLPRTTAGDQVCCLLANLSLGSYLAERRQLGIERSDDVYFANYQVGVRGVQRIDINVHGAGTSTSPGSIVAMMTGS